MRLSLYLQKTLALSSKTGAGLALPMLLLPILSSFLYINLKKENLPPEIKLINACSGSLDENIYTKGDFGNSMMNLSDPLLAPGYTFTLNAPPADSVYTITNYTGNWDALTLGNWKVTGDNSNDPNGNLLLINLREAPHIFYEDNIELCEGIPYQFSFDILNVVLPEHSEWAKLANVDVLLNGQLIYSLGDIPQDTTWKKHSFLFSSIGADQVKISLRNNSFAGLGGDIALDNISINACRPQLSSEQQDEEVCEREAAAMYAQIPIDFSDYSIKWQVSTVAGSWQDVPGANDDTLSVDMVSSEEHYRFVLSSDVSLINTACVLFSEESTFNITPFPERIIDISIQEGEMYNGESYARTTTLRDTIEMEDACDSLIITQINVRPDLYASQRIELCEGDEFLGNPIYNNLVLHDTLVSSIDSDSFILYDIRVLPRDTTLLTNYTCFLSEQGIHEYNELNRFNCDSLIIDVVIFNGGPDTTLIETITCDPAAVSIEEKFYSNIVGCDSVVISQMILEELAVDIIMEKTTCFESTDGILDILEPSNGTAPFSYSIDGTNFQSDALFENLAASQYDVYVRDAENCLHIESISVEAPEALFLDLGPDIIIKEGQTGAFQFNTNATNVDLISWSPLIGLTCTQCKKPGVKPQQSKTYIAKIYDDNGCSTSDTIHVQVEASYVYIPTAFSPNADGFNDHFNVFANDKVEEVLSMEIYDRWGEKLFQKEHIRTGFMQEGWDGKFRFRKAAPGVYFYNIQLLLSNGEIEIRKGEITLLK